MDDPRFESSRPAAGLSQPPIQSVREVLCPEAKCDYLPPSSAQVKNEWSSNSIPLKTFMTYVNYIFYEILFTINTVMLCYVT